MKSAVFPCSIGTDWKTLYRAAILEPDKSVVRQKLIEAESAVLLRAHELVYIGETSDEHESLADALYVLGAYKNAFEYADIWTSSARPQQRPDSSGRAPSSEVRTYVA